MSERDAGPERRHRNRPLPGSPRVIGRARLHPEHIRRTLALTQGEWYPVIEQPAEMEPLEGYI